MRRLLSGAAVVLVLGAASPAWAQNPSGGSAVPAPPVTAMSPPAQSAPGAVNSGTPAVQHSKAMHSFHRRMSRRAAAAGNTTAQLNRRELARIHTDNAEHPAPGPAMPGK